MIRRILWVLVFIFSFLTLIFAEEWKALNGEHFILYYTQDEISSKEILDKAEIYYQRIASDLGYPRYSEFWTWDKRVKIYIYPDRESFLKATGQPEWSIGMADYSRKHIVSYAGSQGFLDSVLPHEMAHLIFRDFVGFKGEVPLWLDEGVAQWNEEAKRKEMRSKIKECLSKNMLLSLEDMMRLNIRNIKDKDAVYVRSTKMDDGSYGILFLSGENLVNTYYLQSVSLVDFLITRFGSDNFTHFCRQLRDGKSLDEALRFTYPTYMHTLEQLEKEWRAYIAYSQN